VSDQQTQTKVDQKSFESEQGHEQGARSVGNKEKVERELDTLKWRKS
jgi:hypothetical protein